MNQVSNQPFYSAYVWQMSADWQNNSGVAKWKDRSLHNDATSVLKWVPLK